MLTPALTLPVPYRLLHLPPCTWGAQAPHASREIVGFALLFHVYDLFTGPWCDRVASRASVVARRPRPVPSSCLVPVCKRLSHLIPRAPLSLLTDPGTRDARRAHARATGTALSRGAVSHARQEASSTG